MKTTVVPAQITTVEDKIAGNLGVSQLLILTVPIFGSSILFVVLPPFYSSAPYKIVSIVCLAVISVALSIRIRGKIVLFWIMMLTKYNSRPRYYIFDKNDTYLRDANQPIIEDEMAKAVTSPKRAKRMTLPQLTTAELVKIENILANPGSNLRFKTNKKGELRVHITEVQ